VTEMEILKENYRVNMSTKFSSNLSSAIREDDWNVKAYRRRRTPSVYNNSYDPVIKVS
jgi:hypothetical protein